MIDFVLHIHDRIVRRSGFVSKAARGQVIVMFAVVSVSLIGMMGLAIDGGFYLYARRTAQAAADAGALAGARQLSKSTAAQADAEAVAAANGQGGVNPAVVECRYVNDANATVSTGSTCDAPPADASGVLIRTQATVPTFFLNVIPGAPKTAVANGRAIARVQIAKGITAGAPFIVCGFGSWDVTSDPETNNGGATTAILTDDDPFTINEAAIGHTFRVWDSRLVQEGAGCDEGSQFKGLANSEGNASKTAPNWIEWINGTRAGPTRTNVNGPGGCAYGSESFDGCILLLPVATNKSGGAKGEIWFVGFAAFRMSPVGSNSYNGTLLGEAYPISTDGQNGWTQGNSGEIVTVRLTG